LHQLLSAAGALEEKLNNAGEQLQLDLTWLLREVLEERGKEFARVVNTLSVLTYDMASRKSK
jgi:hypothetical protein